MFLRKNNNIDCRLEMGNKQRSPMLKFCIITSPYILLCFHHNYYGRYKAQLNVNQSHHLHISHVIFISYYIGFLITLWIMLKATIFWVNEALHLSSAPDLWYVDKVRSGQDFDTRNLGSLVTWESHLWLGLGTKSHYR